MKASSYIVLFCILAVVLLSPLGVPAFFLFQAGELSSARSVASWLVRNDGIYGTALNNNLREISFALYQLRKPDILVMSSSRGVDFRKEFFNGNFGCACSIMSNIEEGQQFANAISKFPKVVIFGLDYWWFSKTDDHYLSAPWRGFGTQPQLARPAIASFYEWIGEGKVSIADAISVMAGLRQRSKWSTEPKLGVQAIVGANGTRADGTWSPLGNAATPVRPGYESMDRMVRDPSLILQEKAGRYSPDQQLDEDRIDQLGRLVETFERNGSKVILMLLPIVPGFLDEMKKTGRYKFIDELRTSLSQLGIEYYDKLDPRDFGGSTCEFKDPHHGGNALYARMLIDAKPGTILSSIVNKDVVKDVSTRFAGRIVARIGTESKDFQEVDFLGIGCKK
jgi:hypothetical protein